MKIDCFGFYYFGFEASSLPFFRCRIVFGEPEATIFGGEGVEPD